jgi:hypothetical protein
MISVLDGQPGGPGKKKTEEKVFSLLVTVCDCQPPIWRRLLVRESMWLSQLHDALQVALDWYDYQTHCFTIDDMRLGNPVRTEGQAIDDDRDATLADLDIGARGSLLYEYFFGEGWRVDIKIEKTLALEKSVTYPACTAGERAGPPEDCGGAEAYHDMLACIKEPHTDIGREWIEWLGPDYDSERCDLAKINEALKSLRKEETAGGGGPG